MAVVVVVTYDSGANTRSAQNENAPSGSHRGTRSLFRAIARAFSGYFFGGGGAEAPPLATFPFLSPEWPWNVRVGANSPSLCPTMFSVTNTGTNLRPLCTAK